MNDFKLGTRLEQLLRKETNTTGASGVLHNHTSFGSKLKLYVLQVKHVLGVSQFSKIAVRMLYIQAPLGETVSVTSGSSMCPSALHSLRFYDSPAIDMLKIDTMQRLPTIWECSPTSVADRTTTYSPVNASIGDLTIIRIINTKNTSLGLVMFGLRWTLIPITDGLINLNTIEMH